jgi:hypothetical protein
MQLCVCLTTCGCSLVKENMHMCDECCGEVWGVMCVCDVCMCVCVWVSEKGGGVCKKVKIIIITWVYLLTYYNTTTYL